MTDQWAPTADWDMIESRARMLHAIRAFFFARGVTEVETPLLSTAAATDPHIESFTTAFRDRPLYLNTSPEFAMKRLLAAWRRPVFQVCKAFRDDELGPLHNPEFTLLEWYRPGYDPDRLMDEIEQLVGMLAGEFGSGPAKFHRVAYAELFEAIELDVHAATARDCRECAKRLNIEIPVGMDEDVDAWRDWLLTRCAMPRLPRDRFTFIRDYPASQSALARLRRDLQGREVAARFELVYGEIELANGFDELRDADEQRVRFEADNRQRQASGRARMPLDERLLAALSHGLPGCSGVAVGLDRLLMVLRGKRRIEDVIAFTTPNA